MKFKPILVSIFIVVILTAACGNDAAKTYKIGIINAAVDLDHTITGFKQTMAGLGYTEGKQVVYSYYGAAYDINKLQNIAGDLVTANVDLILSVTTPGTFAAQKAAIQTDIPVVFLVVTDPVGTGIVSSMRHPGGNITGITFGLQEARRLEWLARIAPGIKKIYAPYNPLDQSPVLALAAARQTATKLGLELITRQFKTPAELSMAIKEIPAEAEAVFLLPDSLLSTRLSDLTAAAMRIKLPVCGANVDAVRDKGALVTYGTDLRSQGEQGARLADQIFRGVKPADLPVETAKIFLAINLKTAKTIELEIPDEILRQADIIFR